MSIINKISVVLLLTLLSAGTIIHVQAIGPNLIKDLSFEEGGNSWSKIKWGNSNPTFTIENNGIDGNKSGKLEVSNYISGDARWSFESVNVQPNTEYETGFFYKSNVNSYVLIDIVNNRDEHEYRYIANTNNSPDNWSDFYYRFTTGDNVKNVNFYVPLSQNGWIQTDNYYMVKSDTQPPAPAAKFNRPLVSIDFDDGWKSTYNNGFPILNEFGYKGTMGVLTTAVESTFPFDVQNYMNKSEVLNLRNQGHRITSHSKTHPFLTAINDAQLVDEIKGSKEYLESILNQPVNYFITPYCSFDQRVTNIVKQFYSLGMRNCDDTFNTKSTFDRYNINSFPIFNTTTDEEIINILDKAKRNNEWIVFMYHKVDNSNEQFSVTSNKLRRQMQLIQNSGIAVKPSQDALEELIPQV